MEKLTLFKANGSWLIKTTDKEVMDLFGTDTIPTAFTSNAPVNMVKEAISRLNPNSHILIIN